MPNLLRLSAVIVLVLLFGCGRGSKQDVLKKAEKATTKAELEKALGKPDRFDKVGAMGMSAETWVYTTSDGEVMFQIVGDKVMLNSTK
jgi:hypothetical protein